MAANASERPRSGASQALTWLQPAWQSRAASANASGSLQRRPRWNAGPTGESCSPGIHQCALAPPQRPRYRIQFTAVNITNVVALYNFLSTFSGTHFVSPRAYTAEIGMVW